MEYEKEDKVLHKYLRKCVLIIYFDFSCGFLSLTYWFVCREDVSFVGFGEEGFTIDGEGREG